MPGYDDAHRARKRIVLDISAPDSDADRRMVALLAEAMHGPYDEGGVLPPGITRVRNDTDEPEPVESPDADSDTA